MFTRCLIDVQSGWKTAQIDTLLRLTERYCVVYQTLAHPVSVRATIHPAK